MTEFLVLLLIGGAFCALIGIAGLIEEWNDESGYGTPFGRHRLFEKLARIAEVQSLHAPGPPTEINATTFAHRSRPIAHRSRPKFVWAEIETGLRNK